MEDYKKEKIMIILGEWISGHNYDNFFLIRTTVVFLKNHVINQIYKYSYF